MADNFDKWRPGTQPGKYYKAFQQSMEKGYNDPNSGMDKNCGLNTFFSIVRAGFELFGGKK